MVAMQKKKKKKNEVSHSETTEVIEKSRKGHYVAESCYSVRLWCQL